MPEIREYINNNHAYFSEWLARLDRPTKARILTRLDRVRRGNFGDVKSVGEGVHELRLDFGAGYRVYFGMEGSEVVIILCGGDKDSQSNDVKKAKDLWRHYKTEGNKDDKANKVVQ